MAKYVRSLDPNLVVVTLEEKDNDEEVVKEPSLRVKQRAAKKAVGPNVQREKKTILPASLFDGMTPRQIKQAKRRPGRIEDLMEDHKAKANQQH